MRRLARPVGEVEVALDSGALPLPPERVLDLEVDLRTVERSIALVDRVLPALAVEGLYEKVGSDAFQFTTCLVEMLFSLLLMLFSLLPNLYLYEVVEISQCLSSPMLFSLRLMLFQFTTQSLPV